MNDRIVITERRLKKIAIEILDELRDAGADTDTLLTATLLLAIISAKLISEN